MSLLLSEDKTELIHTCNCGCEDAIHIRMDVWDKDSYAIQTYLNGNWYRYQRSGFDLFKLKIKKIWRIIRNKDHHYSEIIMTKDDFEKYKEFINQY